MTGVDFSERMVALAREADPEGDFRVDSCGALATCEGGEFDLLVSNYVLMDTPELEATLAAFHRVLKPDAHAVLVFSHPCFPAGRADQVEDGALVYRWDAPYFERGRRSDPPWGHFTDEFIWFHRPLSDYWKAFRSAGFEVVDFEEPRVAPERQHLVRTPEALRKSLSCPYSVAFKLRKEATRGEAAPTEAR